jgi:hypothetical protein
MGLEEFREKIKKGTRTTEQLRQMLKNAERLGKSEEARIIRDQLEKQAPLGRKAKKGGAVPSQVSFRGKHKRCRTSIEGYVWLIDQFIHAKPEKFPHIDWERRLHLKDVSGRTYLAPSPLELFPQSPSLANNDANYKKLRNGWYCDANLSNEHKRELLARIAYVLGFSNTEWVWITDEHPDTLYMSSLDDFI